MLTAQHTHRLPVRPDATAIFRSIAIVYSIVILELGFASRNDSPFYTLVTYSSLNKWRNLYRARFFLIMGLSQGLTSWDIIGLG